MPRGLKRVLALVLAVFLTVGISGAGALMQISSHEAVLVWDSDSGPAPPPGPAAPGEVEPPASTPPESTLPAPVEPKLPVEDAVPGSTEPPVSELVMPGEWTQEYANRYIAALAAQLRTYVGAEAANAQKIWDAATSLAAVPARFAVRAPDYKITLALLDSLARATGATDAVTATPAAEALGLGAAGVELSGAALVSGMNGGAPAVLSIDGKEKPTNRLPSDVTGRDMSVLTLRLTVNGVEVKPVLPVTITTPIPKGASRHNAVLLRYVGTGTQPGYMWPQFVLRDGAGWRMTFSTDSFGEFVFAHVVQRSSSSSNKDTAESRIYDYWRDVIGRIESQGDGGEIYANARAAGAHNVPATVLDALYQKDVTLFIEFGAEHEIIIHGKKMRPVPVDKVFYPFWELAGLYAPDGGPAGMRIELVPGDGAALVPEDGAELGAEAGPPPTYVQTVPPTANFVQHVDGTPAQPVSTPAETVASAPEREESRAEEPGAAGNLEPEGTPVQAGAASTPKLPGSVPIWAPAVIAAGVLAGLGAGTLVASRGKNGQNRAPGAAPR